MQLLAPLLPRPLLFPCVMAFLPSPLPSKLRLKSCDPPPPPPSRSGMGTGNGVTRERKALNRQQRTLRSVVWLRCGNQRIPSHPPPHPFASALSTTTTASSLSLLPPSLSSSSYSSTTNSRPRLLLLPSRTTFPPRASASSLSLPSPPAPSACTNDLPPRGSWLQTGSPYSAQTQCLSVSLPPSLCLHGSQIGSCSACSLRIMGRMMSPWGLHCVVP